MVCQDGNGKNQLARLVLPGVVGSISSGRVRLDVVANTVLRSICADVKRLRVCRVPSICFFFNRLFFSFEAGKYRTHKDVVPHSLLLPNSTCSLL